MSMRATFTTEFIHDGQDGFMNRYTKMCNILNSKPKAEQRHVINQVAGIISGLDFKEGGEKN